MSEINYQTYYEEYNSIPKYRRCVIGTVGLSIATFTGIVLFFYRLWPAFIFKKCDWTLYQSIFIPPAHFLLYILMVYETPEKSVDGLCLLGRIGLPSIAFVYYLFMIFKSFKANSMAEIVIYILLIVVQISLMLPDTIPGVSLFRPFLKRSEEEIEMERFEVVRKYEVPRANE